MIAASLNTDIISYRKYFSWSWCHPALSLAAAVAADLVVVVVVDAAAVVISVRLPLFSLIGL